MTSTRAGRFIAIVGPDGAGKTATASRLAAKWPDETAYFHFRPPIRSRMEPRPPSHDIPPPVKKRASGQRIGGWIRICRSVAIFWLGYHVRIRPAVNRGTLVIADRWAYGYLVQPVALRYYGPAWFARVLIDLLPQPHAVINLAARPEVIYRRKRELTLPEIGNELARWSRLPVKTLVTICSESDLDVIAEQILEELRCD